jgi:DnaA-homolog protein
MSVHPQLPLRIGLRDSATFSNFYPGANASAHHTLQRGDEPFIYLWGAQGTGKSHLLQAACHAVTAQGGQAIYLPFDEPGVSAEMLEGLEGMALVCLDGLQLVAGDKAWEAALFHLYNRLRDSGNRMLVAGVSAPTGLGLTLPDLVSRLGWGPVFQLQPLDDGGKAAALMQRAVNRGMQMPKDVAAYLLQRAPRDMHALFDLLERLDEGSLAAQRRLTIPFVRQMLQ